MTGRHFSEDRKKGSGKLAIIIISILAVAVIVVIAVILLIPSCGNAIKYSVCNSSFNYGTHAGNDTNYGF